MATLEQLKAEPYWGNEITTSPMVGLGLQLRQAYGTGAFSVGIKGNEVHLKGGHRSQEWIKNSAYCTNRTYATQSGLTVTQSRYIAAIDFTPGEWGSTANREMMKVLTGSMLTAMKTGRCNEVVECFGTLDGRTVTGWNNDTNQVVTSDDSHLDHIHIRFNRVYCNDNAVMARVASILLERTVTQDEIAEITHGVWYTKNLPSGTPTLTPATALLSAQQRAGQAADTAAQIQQGMATGEMVAALARQVETLTAMVQQVIDAGGSGSGGGTPAAMSGTGTFTWSAVTAGQ